MKGDFTRRTFRPGNHYRSVLVQQGRVSTDADHNEAAEIQEYVDRTTTADVVGRHGAPAGAAGMDIVCDGGDIDAGGCDGAHLRVCAGRYYVDGILCENEADVPLAAQPDLRGVPLPGDAGRYLAYLDVWAEHVTAIERPELREVALGGPDTATRARTIWQVRLAGPGAGGCPADDPPWTPARPGPRGRLRARAEPPADDPGPCVVPASAGYRRLENQLYRVEIRTGGGPKGAPTFVWSRENGSVAARLLTLSGRVLTIDAPGRDERLGFEPGNWVEVVGTDRTRRGEPGFLAQLDDVQGTKLTVRSWLGGTAPKAGDLGEVGVVRRWESAGELPVGTGWIHLEDGVQVEFEPGGMFSTGDYWLIPARSALLGEAVRPELAGNVDWPREGDAPAFRCPVGIEHHYAPLAVLERTGDGTWRRLDDCRTVFRPLGGQLDIQYAGGDGQEAMPGQPLPQPIEVSVTAGAGPVGDAVVRFATEDEDGRLGPTLSDLSTSPSRQVDVPTASDGVARCYWRPVADPGRPSQRVTAELVGGPLPTTPVHFGANLSVASQVWFDAGSCSALAGADTVQAALDRLSSAWSVVAVGGDGQAAPPSDDLPLPVELLVRSNCGPVAGAQVRFTVASGAVAAAAADLGAGTSTVDIPTGADGTARCAWRLGPDDPVQALEARLLAGTARTEEPTRHAFTASLERGRDDATGLHVTGVALRGSGEPLRNDLPVAAGDLAGGVAVVLDGQPNPATVIGKRVLRVGLDLPYPLSESDRGLWKRPAGTAFGTVPLTLAGDLAVEDLRGASTVSWLATADTTALLGDLFGVLRDAGLGQEVLGHMTLTGRAVTDDRGRTVNGLAAVRTRDDGVTELVLPTVDDVHGADFTVWFWLVPSIVTAVLVPSREGLLRQKSVRDVLRLAVPRTELRTRLRRGVLVAEESAPDLPGAERAAGRGFRNGPGRRLVLVVDDRYAAAGEVIRDALARIRVEVELIPGPDPTDAARIRLAAHDPLDAVLTDDAGAVAITDLGGFAKPVQL